MSYVKKPSVVRIDPTVTHLQPDRFDNDDPIQGYPFGTSAMRVTTATGFPETSGDVITSRTTDDTGSQIFVGNKTYFRTFGMSGWSSWRELGSVSGVISVNGKTGDVVLTAEDVGAETPDGAQIKADQAEQNAKDYTDQEVSKVQDELAAHLAETTQNAHLAKNIEVEDPNGHFTGADLETVLDELFTFASDGKTQIANAITAKGVSASPTETFASLAAKIGQISTGKKWASGAVQSSPNFSNIFLSSGSTINIYTIQVSGLSFRPSYILIKQASGNNDNHIIYDSRFHADYRVTLVTNKISNPQVMSIKEAGSIVVTSTGFTLPAPAPNTSFEWIAIE